MSDTDVIIERIDNLKEHFSDKIGGVHDRLDILNGQTTKNTTFRNKQAVINGVMASIGLACLSLIVWSIQQIIGG